MLRQGFRSDFLYEGVPRPSHNDDLVIRIPANVVERRPELGVRAASPDEGAPLSMERYLQYAVFPLHSDVRVFFRVFLKFGHVFLLLLDYLLFLDDLYYLL